MPARPLSDATVQLIHALRDSLEAGVATRAGDGAALAIEERSMFGCYCFFVDGKLCMGVKADELLVRLPPAQHTQHAEHEGLRELSPGGGMQGYFWVEPDAYQRRSDWQLWVDGALDYNPQAKATTKKTRRPAAAKATASAEQTKRSAKKSSPGAAGALQSPKTPPKAGRRTTASAPIATPAPRKHSVFDDDDL